ncbi:hypothetical protein DDZ13_07530 [Coraliomargarita sinensis]|uniref:Type II secretion system protein GspG C-terminal domain-containing protein n=1 Tax=Coraliomargarita sinensis TaxID=2174842 RepID=A0A317ZFL5_9BACT|nr:prepilin-type N-terminal cleavage/methylation domain-containing protein [Coraliomargarita sinensis]PXA04374.1 hypothetical protein DDZ13_07530 [Coraliomargarita sinensis]
MMLLSAQKKRLEAKQSLRGFTLIELIMVFGVIAILAAITFSITSGVRNAQNRAKAKVELAAISQALEEYKARYGDYPRHDSNDGNYPSDQYDSVTRQPVPSEVTSTMLLYALTGRLKFDPSRAADPVYKVADSLDNSEVENAPSFIDLDKFNYSVDSSNPDTPGNPGALLDPWGNPYIYWYKWENTPDAWDKFGYHLYSTGPNGTEANDAIKAYIDGTEGVLEDGFREVADAEGIIFSGE